MSKTASQQSNRRQSDTPATPARAQSQSHRSKDLAFAGEEEDVENENQVLTYVPSSGIKKPTRRQAASRAEDAWYMSGRQPPPSRSHPLLERFMREDSQSSRVESPAWLWEPQIGWPEEADYEFPL
eukprot:4148915-Amphidinium_carterae.1